MSELQPPLVTVITVSFNHADYVAESLRSVIAQDYEAIEYVVIDDGSTDSSAQIIESFRDICARRFRHFVFVQQLNAGSVATLNRALSLARGEYLFFLASDDVAESHAISRLLDVLKSDPNTSLVAPDNSLIDAAGRPCSWTSDRRATYESKSAAYSSFADYLRKTTAPYDFDGDWFGSYEALIQGNHVPNGTLVRRSAIEKVGRFSSAAPLEDYYMLLQLAKFSRLRFWPEPLLRYRWHDRNTVKSTAHMLRMTIQTVALEKEYCRSHGHLCTWYARQSRRVLELMLVSPESALSMGSDAVRNLAVGLPCLVVQTLHRKILGSFSRRRREKV